MHMFQNKPEIENPQAAIYPGNNVFIRVADSQDALTVATFSIEDASQEAGGPAG
jgi:hypothetical protein